MTTKRRAFIWVVLSSGISSRAVTLLHPVEPQQRPGVSQLLSLTEHGGCFGIISLFTLSIRVLAQGQSLLPGISAPNQSPFPKQFFRPGNKG